MAGKRKKRVLVKPKAYYLINTGAWYSNYTNIYSTWTVSLSRPIQAVYLNLLPN